MLRRSSHTRLRIERLENRMMLTGNVAAHVVAGSLVIRGDPSDNQIAVVAGANPGEFVITGLNNTTINKDVVPVTLHATKGVRIDMRGGANTVNFGDAATPTSIAGGLSIRGGLNGNSVANQTFTVQNVQVGGSLAVFAGSGDDSITMDGSTARSVGVFTGSGVDTITITNVSATGRMSVFSGAGADTVSISGPGGGVAAARSLFVFGGADTDTLTVQNVNVTGDMFVNTGAGAEDRPTLDSVTVGRNLFLKTGNGGDPVVVNSINVTGNAQFLLGAGNDTITLTGTNTIGGMFAFFGGAGNDALVNAAVNTFAKSRVVGFEQADPLA